MLLQLVLLLLQNLQNLFTVFQRIIYTTHVLYSQPDLLLFKIFVVFLRQQFHDGFYLVGYNHLFFQILILLSNEVLFHVVFLLFIFIFYALHSIDQFFVTLTLLNILRLIMESPNVCLVVENFLWNNLFLLLLRTFILLLLFLILLLLLIDLVGLEQE